MSKKYRIGYLDEDEGYQAKFYQAFKNEFDIKILPIENIEEFYKLKYCSTVVYMVSRA